jgi:hexosaminidase
MKKNNFHLFLTMLLLLIGIASAAAQETALWKMGISLIPYPQKVEIKGEGFRFKKKLTIFIDKDASPEDKFTAEVLGRQLQEAYDIGSAGMVQERARSPRHTIYQYPRI